tara:strand:- start:1055 stop:1708 length:654 start_codon:yes stop_codon:yes gene_type:complete
MKNLNQLIIKFDFEQNFKDDDFYVSKSNEHIFKLLNSWPMWEKNFLNIHGDRFSGKTHLINIFIKKFKGLKLNSDQITDDNLKKIKLHENIILENLDENVDEKILYTLMNIIDQYNKFIIVTSEKPIVNMNFSLKDLKSRTNNFLLQYIEKPDDDLMFAIILKNLSDRQIFIDKKLINYIIKRIDRSYSKIFDFIYKIDELSLKKKNQLILRLLKKY